MRTRRGFTLVELLIALVLLSLVTASLFSLLNTTQRVSRAQSERASLQSNVRTGAIVIPEELRQINTVAGGSAWQNDILNMNATSIQYHAMRGLGVLCQTATATDIRIYNSATVAPNIAWVGYRDPVPVRDSVYVFIEGNPDKSSDDSWARARITGVSSTATTCPGNKPGIQLTVNDITGQAGAPAAGLVGVPAGTPIRTYEVMTLSLYQSNGEWWLGGQSNSAAEVMQPMLGPLRSGDGLALRYFDAAGNITADTKAVRRVEVTLRGLSDQAVVSGAGTSNAVVGDSLITQVVLRNSLR